MKINDGWTIDDQASGLRLEIRIGIKLDTLHVESLTGGKKGDATPRMNRDFYFTKDGEFDGTGSTVGDYYKIDEK